MGIKFQMQILTPFKKRLKIETLSVKQGCSGHKILRVVEALFKTDNGYYGFDEFGYVT